jgi:hypothetical protein
VYDLKLVMAIVWVAAPCSFVKFTSVSDVRAACIVRAMSTYRPDDGDSEHF